MKYFLFVLLIFALNSGILAQTRISGTVKDKDTGDPLIGANVLFASGIGTTTDFDGNFKYELKNGTYEAKVSFVGYTAETLTIKADGKNITLKIEMKPSQILDEVKVVADFARARQTPVAFSNVLPAKLEEKLSGRDIPMLLNSTPGVYATQAGGGDGDARITIRGFSSRNVGVLLDGVPVNDMENGTVYWSNWFGLDAVTRTIQVQRGLGASKLALPSVGGTINILTKGMDDKKYLNIKQEFASTGMYTTSFGWGTGALKNGWSFTMAGSYKKGDGWVDHTWTEGYFLYLKVDKKIGKHTLSLSGYGAPQSHSQRSYNQAAPIYDTKWSKENGITEADMKKWEGNLNHGRSYNQHFGRIENYTINNYKTANADTTNKGSYSNMYERVNKYFKPQITLKDLWSVNSKLTFSNILYLSIGKGGGERARYTVPMLANGYMDFQSIRDYNKFHPISNVEKTFYSPTMQTSQNYMAMAKNEHFWMGALSTFNYKKDEYLTLSGGIDLRSYKGAHYYEVTDLLGGDYLINTDDKSTSYTTPDGKQDYKKRMKYVGDRVNYDNDGLVNWGGLFFQAEYKKGPISSFINVTAARSGYKRVDNFKPDSIQETDWKWINGYTAKAGVNYNITENLSAFANIGYLNKAPRFNNVFDRNNLLFREIKNEKVQAVEGGLTFSSSKFSANLNLYYTKWLNRPVEYAPSITITDSFPDPNNPGKMIAGQPVLYSANVNGLAALHKGIELDFAWEISHQLKLQGIMSVGDWIWNSADSVRINDDYGKTIKVMYANAKGLHVGDAAQMQFGGELRYEPVKGLYVSGSCTWFGKFYANFDPTSYDANDAANYANFEHPKDELGNDKRDANGKVIYGDPVQPWKIPSYYTIDLHLGYSFRLAKKYRVQCRANLLNALDAVYVADADDNSRNTGQTWNSHDARSSAVFFGLGRRSTFSVSVNF